MQLILLCGPADMGMSRMGPESRFVCEFSRQGWRDPADKVELLARAEGGSPEDTTISGEPKTGSFFRFRKANMGRTGGGSMLVDPARSGRSLVSVLGAA